MKRQISVEGDREVGSMSIDGKIHRKVRWLDIEDKRGMNRERERERGEGQTWKRRGWVATEKEEFLHSGSGGGRVSFSHRTIRSAEPVLTPPSSPNLGWHRVSLLPGRPEDQWQTRCP